MHGGDGGGGFSGGHHGGHDGGGGFGGHHHHHDASNGDNYFVGGQPSRRVSNGRLPANAIVFIVILALAVIGAMIVH
ncbi:MAG TPA: hypothetical protein VG247_04300 [Pseudonocardiaceae bacterium]|jgi:hypothetical protein|nr:hypothetical protein [Pseudonocardiaceae bacterium]